MSKIIFFKSSFKVLNVIAGLPNFNITHGGELAEISKNNLEEIFGICECKYQRLVKSL